MSMSTPLNTLPLKTQPSEDVSDINDPMVQDVLNEFQEELLMSKKNEQQHVQQHVQQQSQQSQHVQHQAHQTQQMQPMSQQIPLQQQSIRQHVANKYTVNYNQNSFPYSYFDMDIAKQTLIIVIIVVLIYNTTIMEMIYEKLPIYVQDLTHNFDLYIKGFSLFVILYLLLFLQYI